MRPRGTHPGTSGQRLSERERENALRALSSLIESELIPVSAKQSKPERVHCPHCGSEEITRRGKDEKSRQRYRCKSCSVSFTKHSNNPLSATRLPVSTWIAFAECHVDLLSLRESAERCSVSLVTAFHMRHRLLDVLNSHVSSVVRHFGQSDNCNGIEESAKASSPKPCLNALATKTADAGATLTVANPDDGCKSIYINGRRYESTAQATIALAKQCVMLAVGNKNGWAACTTCKSSKDFA